MHDGTHDEERGVFMPPPLTDDESNGEPDSSAETLAVESDDAEYAGTTTSTTFHLPVWLREQSKSFRWRWVPLPLRKAARATVHWVQGPDPPRDLLFKPLFPSFQELPVKYLNRFFPKRHHKIALLLLLYASWFAAWFLVLATSYSSGNIEGYGRPQPISCAASYWSSGNGCGLNGNDCRPFTASTFAFRCPANCKSLIVLEPHTVGNQTLEYEQLVVGGPTSESAPAIYRADSFICQAAIHAGVVTNDAGGCGVVRLEGAAHSYPSVSQNGLTSTGFPSTFPKSFSFPPLDPSQATCPQDPRWPLLGITIGALVILSLFTTSPPVFFFSTFFILILHVGVVSDPPNISRLTDLFSLLFSRLLPATFVAYVLYLYAAHPLLVRVSDPGYQLSRTILYLTPAFLGALNNYTFAMWIPLQRLTPHDLAAQPGAKVALAIVLTIVLTIVLSQAWYIRVAGLMPHYLKIYLTMAAILLILLPLPGLRLRIHHYILAILLMPGTAIPTRASLVYQGLLLGLFVNGVARWGFASIIETPAALGEDPIVPGGWWGARSPNITNSSVRIDLADVPQIMHHKYRGNGNITIDLWEPVRMGQLGVDGVSVLVNDVERWRGYLDEDRQGKFMWHRHGHRGLELVPNVGDLEVESASREEHDAEEDQEDEPEDLFFRFAFLRGAEAGRYGGVGVWNKDGSWIPPLEE